MLHAARLAFLCLILPAVMAASAPQRDAGYDLVIRHAQVIDGSGKPAFAGDVAIRGDRVAALGVVAGVRRTEIDARGLVLAPGFIDLHTHVDDEILKWPAAENFVRDGVTTVVSGNCGSSERNIGVYLRQVDQRGAAVNVATLFGHNTLLEKVKGDKAGELTAEQMEKAKGLVRQAMVDGAFGLSTGLIYSPGQFSGTAEIIELQKSAAALGGIYATHMRGEGAEILKSIDEALTIGREAKCRVQISHFKLPADVSRRIGGSDVTLKRVMDARLAGLEVWLDQYPYTASSTTITTLIPEEFMAGGVEAAREALKDPKQVERLVGLMREFHEVKRKRTHLAYVVVSFSKGYPNLAGRNLVEIAQIFKLKLERAGRAELAKLKPEQLPKVGMEEQYRAVNALFSAGGTQCVFHTMSEADVENIMRNPLVSIARDSGIREFGVGVPHPRGYGSCCRVLGHYVRERKVLTLEEAVRKMTSLPALAFRFADRGLIKEGLKADLTIFDPKTVTDKATFEQPHQYSQGIACVIVNGQVVLRDGKMTGALPGRAIYGPAHDPAKQSPATASGDAKKDLPAD